MKRKFNESAADYYYIRIEEMENRIRSLNSCILDREEERDITMAKAEELTELVDNMDEFIDKLNAEVDRLIGRLQKSMYFCNRFLLNS